MPEFSKVLDEAVKWGQERLHIKLAPGYNPNVKCMRLTVRCVGCLD